MATQFDQTRVTVQPQAAEAPQNLSGVFDKQAAFLSSLSEQYYSGAQQQISQASASFDQALAVYGKEAERRAANDAPATIKYDGEGNVIAPSTFYPPGISTRAYSERFRDVAEASYRTSAEDELVRHSTLMREKFAGDPDAYAAAMNAKAQAMQQNLAPSMAPWIDLRARQIQAQGASVLAVQRQSDQNNLQAGQADDKYQGIVLDASKLAAFQGSNALQTKTQAEINDLIINSATLGQRWKDQEVLYKAAGRSPAFIEKQRSELAQNVVIRAQSEFIKSNYADYYGADGLPNPGKIADMRERIRQSGQDFATRFPGREKQYTEALYQALDFATGQASARAQQIQVNDRRANLPIQRDMEKRRAEADQLTRSGDLIGADAISEGLRQQGRTILNDTTVSDSNAMIRAQAAFQAGAISRATMQEGYTQRLGALVATINSSEPGIGPEHKAAARAELATIRDDPSLRNSLTPGQRGYIESGLNTYDRAEMSGNFAAANLKGQNGELNPTQTRETFQGYIAKGQIHNEAGRMMTPTEAAVVEKQWNDAYTAKQSEAKLAASAYDNNLKGAPSTPDQTAALAKRMPFHNVDEKPDFNHNNPAEVAKYGDYLSTTGITPPMVKESIAAMRKSKNDVEMAGAVAVYDATEAYERRQLDRQLGPAGPNQVGERTDLVKARVAARLGENSDYLLNVKGWGAEKAFNAGSQAAYSPSKSGSAGGPADQTQSALDKGLDVNLGRMGDIAKGSTGLAQLMAWKMPGSYSKDPLEAKKEQATEALLGVTPGSPLQPSSGGQLVRGINIFQGPDQRFTGEVSVDPAVRAFLKEAGTMKMATNGAEIKAHYRGGAEEYVMSEQLQIAAQNGLIEPVASADGKSVNIQFKTANTMLSQKLGRTTPLSEEAVQGFTSEFIKQEAERTGVILPEFDQKNASMIPVMDSNRQMSWLLSVMDRNGVPLKQMRIAENDPRISAGTMAAKQAMITTIYDMKPGMSQADAVNAEGAISRFLGRTENALFGQGRMDDILAGRYVDLEGHRVDVPSGGPSGARPSIDEAMHVYSREFQANLQKLQKEIGPNGPDALEVLKRRQQPLTPGTPDVSGASWLDALIRDLGGGTDKQRQGKQPPTRIGTESR